MPIASINPATGETLRNFSALSAEQIEQKLRLAADTFRSYRHTSFSDRSRMMTRAAEILESEKHELGKTMTLEMGKPLKAAIGEAEKCAWVCRYYAENAERQLADQIVDTNARKSYVRFQPLGPVLAVMPWNFPFWQVFRFAAPALMAGNVGLLKHSSNVPQCALAIEETFRRAGFPDGAFQTLLIGSDAVEGILKDPRVAAELQHQRGQQHVGGNRVVVGERAQAAAGTASPLKTDGKFVPRLPRSAWKYLDQPWATVAAATAYSMMRSQPMIQANSSPRVA